MKGTILKVAFSLSLLLCFLVLPSQTVQQFQKTYGGTLSDEGIAIPSKDTGYAMLCTIQNTLNTNISLVKTDKFGDTVWTKTYDFVGGDMAGINFIQTRDTGFLFTCLVAGRVIAVKTDKFGDTLWVKPCGGSKGLVQTMDGGYAHTSGNHIFKRDSAFNIQWIIKYGAGNLDYGMPSILKQTQDSGFILAGGTKHLASGGILDQDMYIVKTDKNGQVQWTRSLGSPSSAEYVERIIECSIGGYALVSHTLACSGLYDLLVVRLDANGNVTWSKVYGATYGTSGSFIAEARRYHGFIICGITAGFESTYYPAPKSFMIKTDLNGVFQWGMMYGNLVPNPNEADVVNNLFETPDSGYVMSGYTVGLSQQAGYTDAWLIKTNAYGVSGCNEQGMVPTVFNCSLIDSSGGTGIPVTMTLPDTNIQYANSSLTVTTLCSNILTGIGTIKNNSGILMYPNPTNSQLTISSPVEAKVEIHSLLGQFIGDWHISIGDNQIILGKQSPGVYIARIVSEDGIHVSRIIIQ
ncbi:MAG: T9SS type A sorting domain-containing protein [Bacteroidota bacterium]